MLESLINPKRVEKGPWKMFFVGLLYASLSVLLTQLFFSSDVVLSKFSGIIIISFSVMFSLPFLYYIIKNQEEEDEKVEGILHVLKIHEDFIYAFLWLFLGFIIAFSFWNIVLNDPNLFNAQIQTYCSINHPGNIQNCVKNSEIFNSKNLATGGITKMGRFSNILVNNIYVLIFTLIFSLIFGAGAIFVLSWNAGVIAVAIDIFIKYKISHLPIGILRYMIHGFPEIAAYFISALAGGIIGAEIIKRGIKSKYFIRVLENSILLLFTSLIILVLAALIEVYFTPLLFH